MFSTRCQWLEGVITSPCSQVHGSAIHHSPHCPYCQPSPPSLPRWSPWPLVFILELVPKLPSACPSRALSRPPLLIPSSAFPLSLLLIPTLSSLILWLYNQNAWDTASLPETHTLSNGVGRQASSLFKTVPPSAVQLNFDIEILFPNLKKIK